MITRLFTVTMARIPILLVYRRIFEIKSFRIITTVLITTCATWEVWLDPDNMFQCHRVSHAFKPDVLGALDGCIDMQAIFYGTGFSLDLTILVLPLLQIWSLGLERRQKLELTAILCLGGLYVSLTCSSRISVIATLSHGSLETCLDPLLTCFPEFA